MSFSMNNDSEDELEKEEGTEWIHLYTLTSKAKINNLIYAVLLLDYMIESYVEIFLLYFYKAQGLLKWVKMDIRLSCFIVGISQVHSSSDLNCLFI